MKLDRYKQEIVFTILSSLPGKLGGKTYSDFIKLLTGASRVAIVIATAILTLAYINEAHAEAMAADYSGDCSEIDYSGVLVDVIEPSVNTRFCGAALTSNGNAIFLRGDHNFTTKVMSNASVV